MIRTLSARRLFKRRLLYALVGAVSLLWLSPYLWMVIVSFRPSSEALTFTFPTRLTLENFRTALVLTHTFGVFKNTIIVAGSAALLALFLGGLAGYGFSRFAFRGKEAGLSLFLVLRSFPAIVMAIALFTLVSRTGLYDTHLGLVLIYVVFMLPVAVWNMRSIFDGIPLDLEEAAQVDGCTRLQVFFRISLPLAVPGFAATGAFCFLLGANEFLFATVFISSESKKLLTTAIVQNMSQIGIDIVGMLATSVLATLPLVVLFVLIQPYIISGLYGAVEQRQP
jgi:ABC-type glycerol-3-phosphate transport system permease component